MNSQNLLRQLPENTQQNEAFQDGTHNSQRSDSHASDNPPTRTFRLLRGLTPFWHDRVVEVALVLSMALYYIVGNANLGSGRLFQLNPLFSLPFLLIFAVLCWYRLPFAVALLPLGLPYYLQQKTVISHYSFSIAEIALLTCVFVTLAQFLLQRRKWRYCLSFYELRNRLGPFAIPMMVFILAAGISVYIAFSQKVALRAFREEVFDPILYVMLALFCLRSRQDVTRLLLAMLFSGLVVALLGTSQFFLFRSQLVREADGIRRVHAMYGSANSIGLFFDYVLPIGLALIFVRAWTAMNTRRSRWIFIAAVAFCLPMILVLYLSQSRGAWLAIGVALIFIIALSVRNRKVLLVGGLIGIVVSGAVVLLFHQSMLNFFVAGHQNINGISTLSKRLFLWLSALRMIHDHVWFGVGLENWLCYYSKNSVCVDPALTNHHYWILRNPTTGALTGLQDEPTLSHPHNIFLHVWISMGLFGLLAFIAVLVLFFWLLARVLFSLYTRETTRSSSLWWMAIGVGAAMIAGVIQGQVDSAFLVQDLSFCFWMLATALLLLRVLTETPWRGSLRRKVNTGTGNKDI